MNLGPSHGVHIQRNESSCAECQRESVFRPTRQTDSRLRVAGGHRRCAHVFMAATDSSLTHLSGPVDSDAGIYVWNQWVFHRELIERHSVPYFTDVIFGFTGRADLSLHNYTVLANLLALPLIGPLGVVTTFNVTYLLLGVLTAYAMFLLGQRSLLMPCSKHGSLVRCSPGHRCSYCTRGSQHFSLIAAAPLPLFLILLLRTQERERATDAALLGVVVALAMFSESVPRGLLRDAGGRICGAPDHSRQPVSARSASDHDRLLVRAIDVLIICLASLVAAIAITNGWEFTFLGRIVRMRTLYTPVLALTVLLVLRLLQRYRVTLEKLGSLCLTSAARLTLTAGIVAGFLLSPVLYALSIRIADGRYDQPTIFWRSSPSRCRCIGVCGAESEPPSGPTRTVHMARASDDGVRTCRVRSARGHCRDRRRRTYRLAAASCLGRPWRRLALLALGPFIHVAGFNTYIPGPWALLRYLPVIGLARTPSRMAVMVMLVVAILFVLGLRALRHHYGRRVVIVTSVLLLAELLPAPRALYSASVPTIYHTIAADPRADIRVLELPYGVRYWHVCRWGVLRTCPVRANRSRKGHRGRSCLGPHPSGLLKCRRCRLSTHCFG